MNAIEQTIDTRQLSPIDEYKIFVINYCALRLEAELRLASHDTNDQEIEVTPVYCCMCAISKISTRVFAYLDGELAAMERHKSSTESTPRSIHEVADCDTSDGNENEERTQENKPADSDAPTGDNDKNQAPDDKPANCDKSTLASEAPRNCLEVLATEDFAHPNQKEYIQSLMPAHSPPAFHWLDSFHTEDAIIIIIILLFCGVMYFWVLVRL